jgi:magnesium chelatase subunit I
MTRPAYPFTALVSQEEMQLGLLMAAVDPQIGGVLILGQRGTGKSTAVRALAAVLPDITVTTGCLYGCDPKATAGLCAGGCQARSKTKRSVPVVDLPLGASEESIVGGLSLEQLMVSGRRVFEPGLLARANRGFLYVDEINLLEDHLVDLLIDVAASGENRVERDGISLVHPAAFVLVGSGNPEEGELRPQLLDRFGLAVEVTTPQVLSERIEVVRRREAYDRDPTAFVASYEEAQQALQRKITQARRQLDKTKVSDGLLEKAAALCLALNTDGLRGELALMRAARAMAALHGARQVTTEHLQSVAPMVLRHRLRRDVLDETTGNERVARALAAMAA